MPPLPERLPTPDRPVIGIRTLVEADLEAVTGIDERLTGVSKRKHWREVLSRRRKGAVQVELAATVDNVLVGFLIGDARAWEFGSPATGWIHAVGVDPRHHRHGIGVRLVREAQRLFAIEGIGRVRTMVRRDAVDILRFFRSAGFVAGPFVELEAPGEGP